MMVLPDKRKWFVGLIGCNNLIITHVLVHSMKRRIINFIPASLILLMTALFFVVPASLGAIEPLSCNKASVCNLESVLSLQAVVTSVPKPSIATPDWMKSVTTFTYNVETRGVVTASLAEFKQQANETLNDERGWQAVGARFVEVASGGNFTLVLAEASSVPGFMPSVCSSVYSCQVGRYVIINQDRWLGATPSWNNAGGSLRDYRHMVINHETGHWLGHGHATCGGAGQLAAVMQQQSIDLQSCAFNAWPLPNELWTNQL